MSQVNRTCPILKEETSSPMHCLCHPQLIINKWPHKAIKSSNQDKSLTFMTAPMLSTTETSAKRICLLLTTPVVRPCKSQVRLIQEMPGDLRKPIQQQLWITQASYGSTRRRRAGISDIKSLIKNVPYNAPTSNIGCMRECHSNWGQKALDTCSLPKRCIPIHNPLSKS